MDVFVREGDEALWKMLEGLYREKLGGATH
jgi:hypothetical protein